MTETLETISPATAETNLREALTPTAPEVSEAAEQSAPTPQQTAEVTDATVEKLPDSLTDDTRATADKAKQPEATDKNEETQTSPNAKQQSDFAKNAERLDKTWKSVNERKATLDTREAAIKQQETALQQQAAKIQIEAARAKQKFTPEQYDTAAVNKVNSAEQLTLQADGLDKRAEQLDGAGEYGKAELARKQAQDLRDQANGEKYSAKQLKDMAESLRKNPDPTIQQHKATMEQHKRHYLLEAAKVWPDVAKDGSEFQKVMAGSLQALARGGIDPEENPVLFYHVAQAAANQLTAARVPKMEKELGAAQARVKELEGLTAPGGGKGATPPSEAAPVDFAKMSLAQQESHLRALGMT